ncbi:MAG: VWA domain-containing protein [Phycisphaerales bacterium]|nr:VWA domain-containing protein [Phycisphaerales bacterium]
MLHSGVVLLAQATAGERRFALPGWLWMLWLIPVCALVLGLGWILRRRARRRLAEARLLRVIAPGRGAWMGLPMSAGVLLALAGLVGAAARPQADPYERQVDKVGRDVVFVVDVSRSMLADDVAPNRLERVKMWIRDTVKAVEGDRVALVGFAGANVVKCPLTLDYAFFALAMEELSPSSVGRGGTNIGDAIRKAVNEVFDDTVGRHKDIILFTDGEDHGSYPVEAAAAAREAGVRIIAVGVGSEGEGATLPADASGHGPKGTFEYEGEVVRSRLEGSQLARIATASKGGVYLPVGTGTIDLPQVYKDLIGAAAGSEIRAGAVVEYREMFQWFVGAAVVLLMLEGAIRAFLTS